MKRLSLPITRMQPHYDVVVIGSGYGGSIAASRMARAGRRVCLLERGREFAPEEFPDTRLEAAAEMQLDVMGKRLGPRTGLYHFHVNPDINVLTGCGLGGTSLINANVSLEPEPWVFDQPEWPAALRGDRAELEAGFERARKMLRPQEYPGHLPVPAKLAALEQGAKRFGKGEFYRPPLNINFTTGTNPVGVHQEACTGCGDCVSGCNVGAKNSTAATYLPDARNHGAEIFTQTSVQWIARDGDGWLVYYDYLGGREAFGDGPAFVKAGVVVLAAGSLGSTEILLRSREKGLPVSDRLGQGFTGNGDFLGFGYNNDVRINGVGTGPKEVQAGDRVGPCITGIIDLRKTSGEPPEAGMVIEEGVIPGAMSAFLAAALSTAARLLGDDTDRGWLDWQREKIAQIKSFLKGAYQGAVHNTITYLVMAHDNAKGRLHLQNDRLRISWPGAGKQDIFDKVNQNLREVTDALGGVYIKNPAWNRLMRHNLTTVHPLGGCPMGESAATGVTNHKGQVFAGTEGDAVYEGLYVACGSVVPRTLGVNPLLTISALAERICHYMAADRNWPIQYGFGKPAPAPEANAGPAAEDKPGIKFTERMRGYCSTAVTENYETAFDAGKRAGHSFSFLFTIVSEDLQEMLESPAHQAQFFGTVEAPALSAEPLMANRGTFNLFVQDEQDAAIRYMRYRVVLQSAEGRQYFLDGHKVAHDGPGFDVWKDTTTLFVDVYEGPGKVGTPLLKGVLRISPTDFAKQMTTMKVLNVPGRLDRLKWQARFGKFFAGSLFQVYGPLTGGGTALQPDSLPRTKRPLRAGPPRVHDFTTADGVKLRLVRYRGGAKGPVLLAHGLGVSSLIFTIDTIRTNLVEFLFEHGYDVWVLDYRASVDLPASNTQFSADDVARFDWPKAVQEVLRLSGAKDLQVVAHCYGATTFSMAMLRGLPGVRSAVLSQVGPFVHSPFLTRLKSKLRVPDILEKLGIDHMDTDVQEEATLGDLLFNTVAGFVPVPDEDRTDDPVSNRITFVYGPLYKLGQLNPGTFAALHEMFGIANITALKHLALMVREEQVVDASGEDVYVSRVEQLKPFPITFIHGAENQCFLPKSTEKAQQWLRQHFPGVAFERHVIPGYGHIDCIFGQDAHRDVYPLVLHHLEQYAARAVVY
jgi:cholesterol oxidase